MMRHIIYGADGNLYIAGSSTGIGTDNDYTIISLTTSGAENWVYTYNGPANQYDNAYDIVFGSDGNLYATGYSCGIGSEMDITVISLTTSGGERWVYRYNGLGNARDRTRSIIYGADGNIYTGGYAIGAGTAYDFAVISLTSSGTARWIYLYDGPISSTDRCNCIVYGADGNIYGCGHSIDSPTGFDGVVISLTSSGIERWVYRYDRQGMQFGFEELWSLVYGPDSNIYIGGYSGEEEPMLYDFTVISLTSSGTENWVYWYDGLGDGNDSAYDIVYGADGNLYAAGFGGGGGTDIDFTVISLNPEVYVSEKTNYTVDFFDLHCSPNPFSAKTVIEFELPACSEISLKIFDITGSIVRTLFSEGRPKGRYRVVWDGRDNQGENIPSGIYFYQLETENRTAIRKVLKVL
jgi:hypothetical protein